MVFLGESAGAEPKRRLWRIKQGGSGSRINSQTNKDTFLIKPGHLKKPFLYATIEVEGNGFVFALP